MHEEKIKRLYDLKRASESGGGKEKIARKRKANRQGELNTVDPMTFVEIDKYVTHRGNQKAKNITVMV